MEISEEQQNTLEEILGDAWAYRLGEASGLDDEDLDEHDRAVMLRYQEFADTLGLKIQD